MRARNLDPDQCKHGYQTYKDEAGRVHVATGGRCSDVPIPADPARDARVAARRAGDARKAGRALDRYLHTWEEAISGVGSVLTNMDAGEAFVEAVGDYVLSRLQHNRHYGATGILPDAHRCADCSFVTASAERMVGHLQAVGHRPENPCWDGCADPDRHAEGGHDV